MRDGGTLVVGAGLHPDALEEARAAAERHGARLVHGAAPTPGVEVAAPGAFQRRNFALARAAAEAYLEAPAARSSATRVRAAAAASPCPGACRSSRTSR